MHIERLFACAFLVHPSSKLCTLFKPHIRPRSLIPVSGKFIGDSEALSEDGLLESVDSAVI